MDRNSNFELLRIISMMMIVLYHLFMHCDMLFTPLSVNKLIAWPLGAWGILGVDIFVLISAFFLIEREFRLMRVIRLWLCVAFYNLVLGGGINGFSIPLIARALVSPLLSDYWFVQSFILLLLVTPFLNKCLKSLSDRQYVLFSFVLLGVISVYHTIYSSAPIGKWAIFVMLFVFAGLLRREKTNAMIKAASSYIPHVIIVSILIFYALNLANDFGIKIAGHFMHSLIDKYSFIMGGIALLIVSKFRTLQIQSNYINNIAENVLGVYIISENQNLHSLIYEHWLRLDISEPTVLFLFHFLISGIVIFTVTWFIEKIRCIISKPLISKISKNTYVKKIDILFNRI